MKQIFAIFTKDVRHLWPETLASLAMVTALVLTYPHEWCSASYGAVSSFGFLGLFSHSRDVLASCLIVLVPVSWLILIARVVHTEKLVGDTQFWLTRPYEWPKFLAAKLLFLASFLYVPFALAQCVLLAEAGFHPFSYMVGLLLNLFYVTFILVLPFLAVSTITSSFGKLTLTSLCVMLYIPGVALRYSALPSDVTISGSNRLGGALSTAFFMCGCGAVVLVQYARRETRFAWLLIGGTALLLTALGLINPDRRFIDRYYPVPSSDSNAPLQLALATMLQPSAYEIPGKDDIEVGIPFRVAGNEVDKVIMPVAFKVSIQAPDGARWESPWQSVYGRLLPGSEFLPHLSVRHSVYDRFKTTPVVLTLSVAVDEASVSTTSKLPFQFADFTVPGIGICQSSEAIALRIPGLINCRSAMREPPLTYVTGHWTEGDCPAQPTDEGTILGSGWVGSLDSGPAQFGITSVWQFDLPLTNRGYQWSDPRAQKRHICPGTMLTFTSYQRVSSEQVGLTVPGFRLPELSSNTDRDPSRRHKVDKLLPEAQKRSPGE